MSAHIGKMTEILPFMLFVLFFPVEEVFAGLINERDVHVA